MEVGREYWFGEIAFGVVDCSQETFDLFNGHVMEWVGFNFHWFPGGCLLFDLFNDVFIDWVEMGLSEGQDGSYYNEFEHS